MKFGITDQEWILLKELVLKPLKDLGAKIWIFGSRARGTHHKFSDIDLLFELKNNQRLPLEKLSKITELLENSNLPYKVDLVNIVDLAEAYKSSVLQDRVELNCD